MKGVFGSAPEARGQSAKGRAMLNLADLLPFTGGNELDFFTRRDGDLMSCLRGGGGTPEVKEVNKRFEKIHVGQKIPRVR